MTIRHLPTTNATCQAWRDCVRVAGGVLGFKSSESSSQQANSIRPMYESLTHSGGVVS